MKKTIYIILISFALLSLTVLACVSPLFQFIYISTTKYQVEDFDAFEEDFKILVDFTKNYFNSQNNKVSNAIYLGYDTKSKNYTLWYDGKNIEISEELQKSLNRVKNEAFIANLDSHLNEIAYYNDKISFEIDNGAYALVYSFDDKKPSFNIPEKTIRIHTKKIEDHWYHIFKK